MTRCEETRARMTFYLDDELEATECATIQGHLNGCESCRLMFNKEAQFLERVRASQPHTVAPPQLRARVKEILNNSPTARTASPELRYRFLRSLRRPSSNSVDVGLRLIPGWTLVVAALAVMVVFASWWLWHRRDSNPRVPPASDFAEMAAATHQRHLLGRLPLEIVSDVPAELSGWFTGKVPFQLTLPNYQESSGQDKLYRLEGARLVSYKNDYAAYVAYQMHSRPISLVVTSDTVAQASGGEQIVVGEITFHYNSINGLKVITWADRGLTYALVSNLEERGQESCIVCHQGTKDRNFIESLRPK